MPRHLGYRVLWVVEILLAFLSVGLIYVRGLVIWPALLGGLLALLFRPAWPCTISLLILGVVPLTLFMTWSSWGGPGLVCHDACNGNLCSTSGSPYPWLLTSLVLIGLSSCLFRLGSAQERRARAPAPA